MAFKRFTLTKMSTLTKRMSIFIKGMGHARHMVLLVGFFTKVGANGITIKNDYMFLFLKNFFIGMSFGTMFFTTCYNKCL